VCCQTSENRVQIDFFFDSAPFLSAQDLTRAIVERRGKYIPNLMARLGLLAPEAHYSFERLLAQQEQSKTSGKAGGL
jgi:hypothetical protein